MAAVAAVAPVVAPAAVSTGKAQNANSMMVWRPHGNKCVPRKNLPSYTNTLPIPRSHGSTGHNRFRRDYNESAQRKLRLFTRCAVSMRYFRRVRSCRCDWHNLHGV